MLRSKELHVDSRLLLRKTDPIILSSCIDLCIISKISEPRSLGDETKAKYSIMCSRLNVLPEPIGPKNK